MDPSHTERPEQSIDDQMASEMERRRQTRPERRRERRQPALERRRICQYCFQPGDHPTPAHCLRALER